MNPSDDTDHADPPQPQQARFKKSRWPGLIWAAPLAAIMIVSWLGFRSFEHGGPTVRVIFPITGGLKAGNTKVEYKGVKVGTVSAVKVGKSLRSIKVTINFTAVMTHHLGKATQFWIAGRKVSLSNLSSIKSVIAGPFIGIDPASGPITHHFTGLSRSPVLTRGEPGAALTLYTAKIGNISRGSPVYYKNYRVGRVMRRTMLPGGHMFHIKVFIDRAYIGLIDSRSAFWNAGAVHVQTGGSGPSVQIQSVPALFSGAIAFETPASKRGAKPFHHNEAFKLYGSEQSARTAPSANAVRYSIIFPGGPHGLAKGAPVKLEGAPAGVVTRVQMKYYQRLGDLQTRIVIALEPADIPLADAHWNAADPRPQLNAILRQLIAHGLRAQLGSSTPVVGGKLISLTLMKHQPPATLGAGNPPLIPSTPTGQSISQIMAQVSSILVKVNGVTSRISRLSKSPRTRRTLERLDRTVAHIDAITRTTSAQLPQILVELRKSTKDAQAALRSAHRLLASQGGAVSGPDAGSLPRAIHQLTRAATSLRELTDYLQAHPNAVLFGKRK